MTSPGVRFPHGSGQVHAVMLNWNSYEFTASCIASLQRSRHPLARIVVIDNGSTDGSIDLLQKRFAGPQMLFVRNAKNEGFAGGMNLGFEKAMEGGAEFVFSINNDTEVDPDCVGYLIQTLMQNPRCGVVGPTIYYFSQPDKIWQAGGSFLRLRAGIAVPLKGKTLADVPQEPMNVTFLTGCALLVRSSLLRTVGPLDTDYFFYGEDLDYALRVREAGIDLMYEPRASVWHKIDDVAKDRTTPFILYHLGRSTTLLFGKRFSLPYRLYAYTLQLLLYTPFRAWQIARGGAGMPSLQAWLRGLKDGIRGRGATPGI